VSGRWRAPPLVSGHVDVVPAGASECEHDPFGAELVDSEIWSRGTLDMKGGIAVLVTAFLRVTRGPDAPPGDRVLAINSDEEKLAPRATRCCLSRGRREPVD
jgi:acetylornithine deacetylase/succinyl-diaminopimelate desuccinylase-like protein